MKFKKENLEILRVTALSALLLLGTTGCRDWEVRARIEEIDKLKVAALTEAQKTPYRQKQHEALAAYFGAIVTEGVAILEENWRVPLLNAWIDDEETARICNDLFIDRASYEAILKNCRRNRFFLCADEVQTFEEALDRVIAKLSPASRRIFDSKIECTRILKTPPRL